MIWNKEIECADRKTIKTLQLERLQNTVRHVYNKVPLYRQKLDEAGISPDSIKTLADLKRIPFTTKTDLRDNYPFGMFAVPQKEIVRIHASSGTTGKPTVVGYTKKDLDTWSEVMARLVVAGGASENDIVQIAFGYGLFTGAFGLHYALSLIHI